ncbi:hypothetical protein QBC34DRAFT_437929 [Podospora aff. communis PSN243]|uniref:Uncharacterized protein n=1 Tax=Podospora aff. communis PSN243 TaxID=3040156 RepID=A0AAV9GPI8_9PEZI|nr:hypothetical protein QBC34DRAFT_437929 [Podospora aff. communis PSN243]
MAQPRIPCQAQVAASILFLSLFTTHTLAIDCSKGPFVVATQQDADALNGCTQSLAPDSDLHGDVVVAPSASGDLNISYHRYINGNFIAENAPLLQALVLEQINASTQRALTKNIVLRNLSSLSQFTHHVRSVDSLTFQDLPSLEMVDLSPVNLFGALELENLPKLQKILLAKDSPVTVATNLTVRNVDFDSDAISSLLSNDFGGKSTAVIEGIPNANRLLFGYVERKSVTIKGNGNLSVLFTCSAYDSAMIIDCPFGFGANWPVASMHIPDLTISGVSNLTRDSTHSPAERITMGTLQAINNTFKTVSPNFENLTSLYLIDNPNLREVRFRPEALNYSWSDIVISGNPELRLKSAHSHNVSFPDTESHLKPVFIWPRQDTSTMVFKGAFDNAFL